MAFSEDSFITDQAINEILDDITAEKRKDKLLEIFDATLPRYRLRFRLKVYFDYLSNYEWEGEEPRPLILLVLPNLNDHIYAKRRVKKLLLDEYYEVEEIPNRVNIQLTTIEKLKEQGISAGIWEKY